MIMIATAILTTSKMILQVKLAIPKLVNLIKEIFGK